MDGETLIDRYILEEIVGEGSYSIVFRGYDQQDKKKVAIKELKSAGMTPEEVDEASRLFFNEINILKNLSHPNIAKVYDFFIFQGRQYMVMEWVDGENLEEILQREGKVCQEKALVYLKQAADALCYLQSVLKKIVYRDFKPSNLIVDKHGKLKIIDFGIARHYSPDKTKDTHILGTPGYAPPEAFEGRQTDFSSDIYSLGATIYHITTGEDPLQFKFKFPNPRNYNQELTYDFATLLQDCLKPAGERIANGVELQRSLRKVKKRGAIIQNEEKAEAGKGDIESRREWGRFCETGEIPTDSGKTKKKSRLVLVIIIIVLVITYSSAYLWLDPDNNNTDVGMGFFFVFLAVFLTLIIKIAFLSDCNTPSLPIFELKNPFPLKSSLVFKSDPDSEAFVATIILSGLLYFILGFFFFGTSVSIGRKLPLWCMVITMVILSLVVNWTITESTKTGKAVMREKGIETKAKKGEEEESKRDTDRNTGADK